MLAVAALIAAAAAPVGWPLLAQNAYTLYTSDARRSLPVRTSGNVELVSLDNLTSTFSLTLNEDPAIGGLTIRTRGQRIIAFPGQSFVRVGERVVSLAGQIQRERNGWWVPVDFLSQALGPAVGIRVEVRRESRIILVGEARVPRVSGRIERAGTGARLELDVQPPTPHRVARDGNRMVIRFEAAALDASGIATAAADFARSIRVDGSNVIIEIGPAAAQVRVADDSRPGRVQIDFLPPGAPPPAPPAPPRPPPPVTPVPVAPAQDPVGGGGSGLRTIVIDPGHGGDDEGARGPAGAKEKDQTLEIARRLKAAIEARMGLRVLLTRDGDQAVAVDQRTAVANNNKADLFLSLHINASSRPSVHGAQVLTLAPEDYGSRGASVGRGMAVPVVGGGMRVIAAVPWDLAQIPVADRSAALAALLVEKLREQQVPLYTVPAAQVPLRVLVGASMPAMLIELGFLTNAEEELALSGAERQQAIVEALLQAIAQIRRGPAGGGVDPSR
jgi:N-acetylmuramoyl-L-alanine amidase